MLSHSKCRISTLNRKLHVLLAVDSYYMNHIGTLNVENMTLYNAQSNDGEINNDDKQKTKRPI